MYSYALLKELVEDTQGNLAKVRLIGFLIKLKVVPYERI